MIELVPFGLLVFFNRLSAGQENDFLLKKWSPGEVGLAMDWAELGYLHKGPVPAQ